MDTLVKFIKDNDLSFRSAGSELNSECTIISGFALYQNKEKDDIIAAIREANEIEPSTRIKNELERVFKFAKTYHYGAWWHTHNKEAKKLYKF